MDYYQSQKICENVTKIGDITGVYAYLVEGSQRAVLIDTCSGFGDLKAYVEGLTNLPLTVICTHGHVDHAGGAYGFEDIYLSEKDNALFKEHTTLEFRREYALTSLDPQSFRVEDIVPQREEPFKNLVDGQTFDLGGITLEAIALPGHTRGMSCILFREIRTLLLGDGCNSMTFMFVPDATSIEEYQKNLSALLAKHEERYDAVWFSHGHNSGPKEIVYECIQLCDEIMADKSDKVPFEFMGMTAYLAKAIDEKTFSRIDGGTANIVFDPKKIFSK